MTTDPDFPKAGIKLAKLEESTGKDYTDIVSEFEQLGEEIAARQETITTLKVDQEKEEKSLEELELARKEKEAELAEFQKEAGQKKAAADAEVNEKLAEAGLTMEKVAKLHPVVEKMSGLGISDDKLEIFVGERQVLEEYGITSEKFQAVAEALAKVGEIDGHGLAAKLAEYGTLEQAVTSLEAKKTSLQPEVEKLGEDKVKLAAEVDGLVKSKAQLEIEVGHLNGSKEALEVTTDTLKVRSSHLEKHLAVLEKDVSKLAAENTALVEEVGQKQQEIAEMNEELKEADAIGQVLMKKKMEMQEMDTKIAAAGQNFQWYEAFKGALAGGTRPEIQAFIDSVPALISEAKAGKYTTELLLNFIVDRLTGGAFALLACQHCEAKLVMVKRGKKYGSEPPAAIPVQCPDCGFYGLSVETSLSATLKKGLGP